MTRWLRFLLALVIGLIFGLVYGWIIKPVEIVDISPSMLSPEYQVELTIMVAEVYSSSSDLDSAISALTALFPQAPGEVLVGTLEYARTNDYTQTDIAVVQLLANAISTRLPGVSP